MKWLVTGGLGFIGSRLLQSTLKHSKEKTEVRVLDDLSFGQLPSDMNFEFMKGDIADPKIVDLAMEGVDIVIHLAAQTGVQESLMNPRKTFDSNIKGTFNLLEAARENNCRKFIYASSGAAALAISPYGASKLAGEALLHSYYKSYGLETLSLRFSNIYGPGSLYKSSVVAKLFKNAKLEKKIKINGEGTQTRDFLFVDDLIEVIQTAATQNHNSQIWGEVLQVGTGVETPVVTIAKSIQNIVEESENLKIQLEYAPKLPGDIDRSFADISKISKALNWKPKTDLHKGLLTTWEHLKPQIEINNGYTPKI